MMPVRLEPAAPRSGVKHSTTEPLLSPDKELNKILIEYVVSIYYNCATTNFALYVNQGKLSIT